MQRIARSGGQRKTGRVTSAVVRVGPNTFGSAAQWAELVDASHRLDGVDLVLCGERPPLTDLVGRETADAVMPLSLFEAPADTAGWACSSI